MTKSSRVSQGNVSGLDQIAASSGPPGPANQKETRMKKLILFAAIALPLCVGAAAAQIPAKSPEASRPITYVAARKSCTIERAGAKSGHCIVKHRRHVRSPKEHAAHAAPSKAGART
jgi:hypothetical protein